jgi:hypothetical protein
MKALRIIFTIVLVGLLTTCTKFGKNITVQGRVLNPITGEGIAGVEVWLQKTTMGLPGGKKTIKSVTTDADGNFELDKLTVSSPEIVVNSGGYHRIGWWTGSSYSSFQSLPVKKGKKMNVDYHMVPYGTLQINIHNLSCFDSNDELKIYRTHSIIGFYDNVPNPAIYTGCINQTGNVNKAPMGWYKYNGMVTKNGIVTPKMDSIYLNEGESRVWSINY